MTRFQLGDLSVPVIQAPMAGVATPLLASEVSRAGGLGTLGLGSSDAAQAGRMMAETARLLGSDRYGVNLFCHRPAQADPLREAAWLDWLAPEFRRADATPPTTLREIYRSFRVDEPMLRAVLDACPVLIGFHFGLPDPAVLSALRQTGAMLVATATSLPEGTAIRDAGLDAIIAQGYEAGGHRGVFDPDASDEQLSTLDLVARLKPLGLPLIAAGGIMDGRDAAHHLRNGASAVQMGTAFVACPESAASDLYRQRLTQDETVMTRAISGRPARGLKNRLTALGVADGVPSLPDYPIAYDAAKALHAAIGGSDYAAHWAGTGAARARAMPAARLVHSLAGEIEQAR